MIRVIVWYFDEFGNKNLHTVKEFESIFIAEEYLNKEINYNNDLIAEIES